MKCSFNKNITHCFVKAARLCALLILAISLLVLAGWLEHNFNLQSFYTHRSSTKVNAALCMFFSGLALLLYEKRGNNNRKLILAKSLSFLIFFTGALTLSEYAFQYHLDIDELFFKDLAALPSAYPGRMAVITALALIFSGTSLWLHASERKMHRRISQTLAALVLIIGFLSLLSFLYNASMFYEVESVTGLAFPTTLYFITFGAGVLLYKPQSGFMAAFAQATNAAKIGFRLLVTLLSLLLIIGWLRLQGQALNLYDTQFGLSIMITVFAVSFSIIIWRTTKNLNALEHNKEQLTLALEERNTEINNIFGRISDAFIAVDKNWQFTYLNTKAYQIMGRDINSLIGKNIWDEFPVSSVTDFYKTAQKAMQQQRFMYLEEYAQNVKLWIEYHLYPSENGLSIYFKDVSERKKAEQQLKASEERFRSLIENASDAIFIADDQGNFLEANNKASELTGYCRAEILELSIYDILALEDKTPVAFKAFNEGRTTLYTRFFKRKDGSVVTVESSAKKLPDGRLLAMVRDITERIMTQEEILRSNERFELLAQATNDAIWDWNLETNEHWWSENTYKLMGYDRDAILPSLEEWYKRVHPSDAEQVKNNFDKIVADGKKALTDEFRFLKPDGTYGTFYDRGYVMYNEQGKPIRIIGAMMDLSELKKIEQDLKSSHEKYRQLFNVTPIPAWVVDNETQSYLAVNEAAINNYGYSYEEFTSMNIKDLQPSSQLTRYFDRTLYSKESYNGYLGVWKHKKKDGSIIDVEIVAHEIMYEGRKARLALATDITEKLRMQKEMKHANEELHTLSLHLQNVREEERMHIAREIHDELGQQLTGLKMDVFWLNKKIKVQDESINHKITEILQLIDETVKSVRRISSNLRPSILDDLGLIAALEWHSQEVEKRSEISVQFIADLPDIEIPTNIKTGLFRIYQEALTNAVRHANAHQICSRLQLNNHHLTLEINDDGQGFETQSKEKKTFGLLGIKERTYIMGGTYQLASYPGNGTSIKVSVPV